MISRSFQARVLVILIWAKNVAWAFSLGKQSFVPISNYWLFSIASFGKRGWRKQVAFRLRVQVTDVIILNKTLRSLSELRVTAPW